MNKIIHNSILIPEFSYFMLLFGLEAEDKQVNL